MRTPSRPFPSPAVPLPLCSGKSLAKGERKVLNRGRRISQLFPSFGLRVTPRLVSLAHCVCVSVCLSLSRSHAHSEIDELRLRVVNLHDLIVQTLSKNLERSIDDDDDDDYFEGSRGGADGREEEYEDDFDIMEDEDVDMPPEGEEPELSAWESSYAMPMSPLDLPPDAQSAFIARQSSWGDDSEAGQFGDTLSEALDDAPPSKATLPMTREALESRVTDLEVSYNAEAHRRGALPGLISLVSCLWLWLCVCVSGDAG